MAQAANRAQREGLHNALFVVASVESLPTELDGIADRVTVLFPWASLLDGVARPDPVTLAALARVAQPAATLKVLINRSALRCDVDGLDVRYGAAGIDVERLEWVSHSPYRTTWAKRVTHRSGALHLHATFGGTRPRPLPRRTNASGSD